ncbi:MAG: threonine--tRNA ligase [Gammaproteobacteria bacterium]|nr:threonine--tRNA ligase [Gammaproteobacteria bacterium]
MSTLHVENIGKEVETNDAQSFADVVKSCKLKHMVAAKVGDRILDLSAAIDQCTRVQFLEATSEDGVDVIRHSTAHLLAHAVKTLYPDVQVTIGPVIDKGFYYDFSHPAGFKLEELPAIEKKMKQIVKQRLPVERLVWPRDKAIAYFKEQGEHYKAEIISDLDASETISLYKQGDFIDLCRGPHVPNTGLLGAFKLTKVAGAYWRGDSDNEMLQRIYGTAWGNDEDLKAYLHQQEEAERRDHRKLAKIMNLFHFQDTSPGMVFWHHNGYVLYQTIIHYMRQKLYEFDYEEIATPMILDKSLWEASGHWEKFRDDMFVTEAEDKTFCVKPMNCPGGLQVYNVGLKSYRDLPLKMGEFGFVHRNELSGALHGLMRLRAFTQDDAHVFCAPNQLDDEVAKLITLVYDTYKDFGFTDIEVRVATRPEKRIGSDEDWDKSEQALSNACDKQSIAYTLAPNEGAFYGPKIEFHLRDCLGRVWQCGTIQIDYSMPGRLNAFYIDDQGQKAIPIMIHRAIFGSIERFIGILIEHYAGRLPLWLAPTQIAILTVSDQFMDYAKEIEQTLKQAGFRVKLDKRNEKLGFKIRDYTLKKVPYEFIIGESEQNNSTVSIRCVNGEQKSDLALVDVITALQKELATKTIPDAKSRYGLFQEA